jgi:hypothetical protein
MHFMHRMHLTEQKRVSAGFIMNLVGYNSVLSVSVNDRLREG